MNDNPALSDEEGLSKLQAHFHTWTPAYQLCWGQEGSGYLYNWCSQNYGEGKGTPSASNF